MNQKKISFNKMSLGTQCILAIGVILISSDILMNVMHYYGYFASGNDVWGHLFKSDLMYKSIREGDIYPLYTKLWYNGIQPYRYWAPLPYYIMAALQWISGGNIVDAYYLFVGFSFAVGAFGWLLFGLSLKRVPLGTFIGIMWFFLPENIRVFFCEGNVPRMVTAIFIPYLVYFTWRFFVRRMNKSFFGILVFMSLITLSHVMISAMTGIASFIFLFFYVLHSKQFTRAIETLLVMILSFAVCGIWLFPALTGGLVGMDPEASASVMKSLSYSLLVSLNPLNRINGIVDTFYYGLSVFVISIIGLLLARTGKKAGFSTAILILLLTTTAAVPILSKLPLSQLLWMMRFSTIAYAYFLWSIIEWKSMRKYFCILIMFILLIDCLPSFQLSRYYTQGAGSLTEDLKVAKEITNQRVAILDLSTYGSYPSWELSRGGSQTEYSYGWAWQGAATASNIVMLNTALEVENYTYLFDRSIELGDDTVIIKKELVGKNGKTSNDVLKAAALSGYKLYKETEHNYIYHIDTPDYFGVVTEYKGFAIGKHAKLIVLPYPVFTTGDSYYLDDYNFDQLVQYEVIYLSGFLYHDKEAAEDLVKRLSESGVKVVIDMSHIPEDATTKRYSFLKVIAQPVTFEKQFPTLIYKQNEIEANYFVTEYEGWNTFYLDGIENKLGVSTFYNQNLVYAGTNDNENVVFLGFNLLFHAIETDDDNSFYIMNDILGFSKNELPYRTIVPMEMKYLADRIVIDSQQVPVNTTIAYQDNFLSINHIESDNNQLIIKDTHTEIQLVYPFQKAGTAVSIIGVLSSVCLFVFIQRKSRKVRRAEIGVVMETGIEEETKTGEKIKTVEEIEIDEETETMEKIEADEKIVIKEETETVEGTENGEDNNIF